MGSSCVASHPQCKDMEMSATILVRRATLLNVNEPEVRGVALALQTVLDDLGKGLGPLLVSLMVSAWGS